MKKRLLSLLLASILLICMCSCTSNETAGGNYDFSKKLELTVWETQGTDYVKSEQPDENIVLDWLTKKTNVEVTNIYGNGGGSWDAKLTKLVAGGNLPHIVHCGAGQGPAHFAKLDELKQLWHLTPEMLKEHAPNAWKRIPKNLWDKMTTDGYIMGIPYYIPINEQSNPDATAEDIAFINDVKNTPFNDVTYSNSQCLWIRDDVLRKIFPDAKTYDELVEILEEKNAPIGDELLDIPIYTTEEFIDFMYDIRDLKLKSNGKKVYAFGYNGGDNWSALTWLGADMYGYKTHNYASTWNNKEQKIDVPLVGELVKKAAKTQNKMIADGVIEKESLAHTSQMYSEKALNGQYVILPIDLVGGAQTVNAQLKEIGADFRFRPFITQVPNVEEYPAYKAVNSWGESLCFLKTLSENELIQTLRWIDTQFSDEYEEILNWGPAEAELYVENEDGTRTFKDEAFNKFFIYNDADSLSIKETKGLGGSLATRTTGLFSVRMGTWSRWTPFVVNRVCEYVPTMDSGFKFASTSKHVENVVNNPPSKAWDPLYAKIPEVIDYWAERNQWENKFTLALAATPKEFEKKWQEAVDTVYSIADVDVMTKEMTKIAKQNMP